MGDVGYLDAGNRLWFCGRKSQRVVTSSGTFYTIHVKGFSMRIPTCYGPRWWE